MSGKGSGRRPAKVADATVQSNWDRIFGKKQTIVLCADCEVEVDSIPAGDENYDYCSCCERVVEGNTITKEVLDK